MWGWVAAFTMWRGTRQREGTEAGRTLVVVVFFAVWIVAGILELLGVKP